MPVELRIPPVGESITEVTIGAWRKAVGAAVDRDEELVELETDKATFDLPSPVAGVIAKILKKPGETAAVGEVVGLIDDSKSGTPAAPAPTASSPPASSSAPAAMVPKKDVAASLPQTAPAAELPGPAKKPARVEAPAASAAVGPAGREERLVPMSPIRRRIAERLVEAQRDAALLTTFNEIDMTAVVALRKKYRDSFQAAYGVKLGFMSFFVKAVVESLSAVPQLNAEIRGTDIVFRNYYDIGVAIGGGKGLVVPVLRNAERLSFAEIERTIADFGHRAGENKIKLEELQGGTFTISNGGVYGSLLSTPIVNPPQSGVLGMHAIQDRPVVRDGAIVIRPMMYVALTYDHRVVDGREAVTFLTRVRDIVEDPTRLLIEI
ncbi:MAG: dihydrolipoyllysine-residue succinyltransferase [Planctomycetia bacterium]|nr:dihydrolipoyllysine-residue succinyltransferase [Planctomycetia bacterium]